MTKSFRLLQTTTLGSLLLAGSPSQAQNFVPTPAPTQNWVSLASSSDGTRLAIVASYGSLYTSTNSGATWAPATTATTGSEPSRPWTGVASSTDGRKLVAVAGSNPIFTSANYGQTWSSHGPAANWSAVASSADGTKLVALDYNMGRIYTSTDSGNNWAATASPIKRWRSVASSADGTKLVAGSDYGTNYSDLPIIYVSTNSGATWKATSAPNQPWQTIASSADGTKLAAGVYGGLIYLSTDSGASWNPASVPSLHWGGIAASADGTRLAAAASEGMVYVSADSGHTWTTANAPTQQWQTVACSSDGIKLAAGVYDLWSGGVYTAVASPTLNLTMSGNTAVLSWPASATGFTVQQSPEAANPTWMDVAAQTSLVNGNNQMAVSAAAGGHGFYRLIHR
jgi:photosystem II stability/assembly factor-like uncharacterized protein